MQALNFSLNIQTQIDNNKRRSDYSSTRHVYLFLLELGLLLALGLIMLASLALTRMDCNRIANYLMLPVFLGLIYFNAAHQQRQSEALLDAMPATTTHSAAASHPRGVGEGDPLVAFQSGLIITNSSPTNGTLSVWSPASYAPALSLADSLELLLCNGLIFLCLVQLAANAIGHWLPKVLN